MKKHLMFSLLAVLLLFACGCRAKAEQETGRKLTLMVYMCGSSLEEENGAATKDIQEMLDSGCDFSQVSVVILAGGSKAWHMGLSADELTVLELGAKGKRIRERLPAASMGDPATLDYLLSYGKEQFPAEEYALILWDHGAGPLVGICRDDLFSRDMLTLDELTGSLEKASFPGKLSWIGFDACLMGSLEVAAAMSPYAEHMVASEELEPSVGWDYTFLRDLAGCASGREAGQLIVDRYAAQETEGPVFLTLASMDLGKMAAVQDATDRLFDALFFQLNGDTFSRFSRARQNSLDIGSKKTSSDFDLVDLLQLSLQFEQEKPAESLALRNALEEAVYARGNLPEACGVSIYFPLYNKYDFQHGWMEEYREIACLPVYTRYLGRYAGIWLGEQLADWTLFSYGADPLRGETQTVRLELTEEQLTHFASAKVAILRETGSQDTYQKVYEINDVRLEGSSLTAEYAFDGLYLVNEQGELLTDSYPFEKRDEYYYVNAMLETNSIPDETMQLVSGQDTSIHQLLREAVGTAAPENSSRTVRLVFRAAGGTDALELVNIVFYDDASERIHLGRQSTTFDSANWPWLYFFQNNIVFQPERDESGQLLPVSQWAPVAGIHYDAFQSLDGEGHPQGTGSVLYSSSDPGQEDYHLREEVRSEGGWSLCLKQGPKSGMNLYAQYIVTDTQGNETASELIPLENQAVAGRLPVDEEVLTSSRAQVRLKQIDLVRAESESGLALRFHVRNDSEYSYRLSLLRPVINGTGVPEIFHSAQPIRPGSEEDIYVRVPLESFPVLPDGTIHSLSFVAELENQERSLQELLPAQDDSSGRLPGQGDGEIPDHLLGERVTIQLEMDVSILNIVRERPEEQKETLGETTADGILFRLVALREEQDGSLSGTLYLANRTDGDRFLYTRFTENGTAASVTLNGCLLAENLDVFHSLALPAGSSTLADFRVLPGLGDHGFAPGGTSRTEGMSLLDYWGIRQIESIGLVYAVCRDSEANDFDGPVRVTEIRLDTPLPLERNPEVSLEKNMLIDDEVFSVSLREVSKKMKSMELRLDIRNKTDRRMMLILPDGAVDQTEVSLSMASEIEPVPACVIEFPWRTEERVLVTVPLSWDQLRQDPETIKLRLACISDNGDTAAAGQAYYTMLLGISRAEDGSGYRAVLLDLQYRRQ